jgi:hypothetical protein
LQELKVKKDSGLDNLTETHAQAAAKEREVKNFANALGIRPGIGM